MLSIPRALALSIQNSAYNTRSPFPIPAWLTQLCEQVRSPVQQHLSCLGRAGKKKVQWTEARVIFEIYCHFHVISCMILRENHNFNSSQQVLDNDSPNQWDLIFTESEGQVSCVHFSRNLLTAQQLLAMFSWKENSWNHNLYIYNKDSLSQFCVQSCSRTVYFSVSGKLNNGLHIVSREKGDCCTHCVMVGRKLSTVSDLWEPAGIS